MIQRELAILITRTLSGEATEEEQSRLKEWLKAHPEDRFFIESLQSYWNDETSFPQEDLNARFPLVMEKATSNKSELPHPAKSNKRFSILPRWLVAAAVAGLLLVSIWQIWQSTERTEQQHFHEITTAKGEKSYLLLPDGSKVWLNSGSTIYYDKEFSAPVRQIRLKGEAFFDVVKDANKPFVVQTPELTIKVLGTSFNVKAYENDGTVETTLIRGSVQVVPKVTTPYKSISLKPGEKAVYLKEHTDEKASTVRKGNSVIPHSFIIAELPSVNGGDSSIAETSWIYNRLVFEGDTFIELAKKMERWYDISVVFKNKEVSFYRLRGAFEDETLEQALKGLQLIAPFNYSIKGNTVEIY